LKNGKFINTITKMQNFPRWDEYAPKFEDNTANHSYRTALYSLLAALIEKRKFGKKVDIAKVVCRAIFHDINETKTGPIKHRTKKDPDVREHIKRLEHEASEEIVSYLSSSLQPVFYDFIVNAEDSTFEGRIVDAIDTFDALMFCKREVMFGSTYFFPETYEELADKLRNHELESIRWMMREVDNETEFFKFMFSVLMLDRVRRWKGKFNLVPDNDAAHEFRATAFAIFNGYVEKIKYGVDIDIETLVIKTLCHDIVEEWVGDVLGPVKHSTPETKKAFEEYEKKVSIQMADLLPDFLKYEFEEYMANAKSDDYVGTMVDIVDKMDALIKANMERRHNRMEYEIDYRKQLKKIQQKFDNPCVMFFLAYILHDLDYPLFDELSE